MRYYVFRKGYNVANNSVRDGGPETIRVAEVEADNAKQAVRFALESNITCYNNQVMFAELARPIDERELRLAQKVKRLRR